jgi:ribosome production factor 1
MPTTRFEPSSIKNKIKREEISRKNKKAKNQQKLEKRLAQVKLEANDPAAKKVRFKSSPLFCKSHQLLIKRDA